MAHVILKDLVKTYGAVYAVRDVSLTVDDGEFVALVGPSGCGKTTTLNLVAGLIPITSAAIMIGDRVVNGTLDFLEEPIRDETPGAYEALRKLTDVPFAIGEEFSSKWQFLPFIERDLTQFNRIDICNVGGLTEAMKVAAWTEAHYIDMMPHNPLGPICTAATVHFAAAVANFAWLETRASPGELYHGFDDPDLFPGMLTLEGACYRVSDRPGLGVDVDEALVAKQSYRPWEAPHLVRKDGSVTNW